MMFRRTSMHETSAYHLLNMSSARATRLQDSIELERSVAKTISLFR